MFSSVTNWYQDNARSLPWRKTDTSPWAILVCEVMSQQTPVSRVIPAWNAWLEQWDSPQKVAQASTAEVLVAWNRLGYPRRALRLRECAAIITEKHDGRVPDNREDLLALPGIGEYTADAILAFAFQRYSVVLDTNIRRVLARLAGRAYPSTSATRSERSQAQQLVPLQDAQASLWNASIMELGALICTASNPHCQDCPLSMWCEWFKKGKPDNVQRGHSQGYAGTHREARGKILNVLRDASGTSVSETSLRKKTALSDERFTPALQSLLADLLAEKTSHGYQLPR